MSCEIDLVKSYCCSFLCIRCIINSHRIISRAKWLAKRIFKSHQQRENLQESIYNLSINLHLDECSFPPTTSPTSCECSTSLALCELEYPESVGDCDSLLGNFIFSSSSLKIHRSPISSPKGVEEASDRWRVIGPRVTRLAAGEYSVKRDKSRRGCNSCRRYSNASAESCGWRSMINGSVGWLLERNSPELSGFRC